ncbi:MAG TPA: flippase [Methanomicrobiales archaeon]|nr:flippase [Methanomicrobiales archaeon]
MGEGSIAGEPAVPAPAGGTTGEIVGESLKRTARGTVIAFIGMIVFLLLEFAIRVIIARGTSEADYGVFNIGYVLLSFFIMVAGLGLNAGAPRYIAFFRGAADEKKIAGVVSSSLRLSLAAGIAFFVLFLALSGPFASVFHLQSSSVFQVFALAIPFGVMTEIFAAIFIGYGRMEEKVLFRDTLASVLRVFAVAVVILLGYGLLPVIWAYVLGTAAAAVLFAVPAMRRLSRVTAAEAEPMAREIIRFSLPLWTTNILNTIIFYLDTLILGYFTTATVVGLYNAARPITQFLNIFIVSLSFIYVPVAAQLYAANRIEEIRRNYVLLTKWIFLATIPFFLVAFLFPGAVVGILFGAAYGTPEVALTLQVLSVGILANVIAGPNAPTLIVLGKPRLVLLDNFVAAVIYVGANLLLIPTIGMVGAAIAATLSLLSVNVIKSIQIYRFERIHPFSANYLKTLALAFLSLAVVYGLSLALGLQRAGILFLLSFAVCFLGIYAVLMYLTGSFDREEVHSIRMIYSNLSGRIR